MATSTAAAANAFWGRDGLRESICDALGRLGKDPRTTDSVFTMNDLAPVDQFHGGGIRSSRRLATLAGEGRLDGATVIDVGGGLGGPARLLAAEHNCRVTSIDITESYVVVGAWLTSLAGLSGRVTHVVGDALALPAAAASADVVWMQNAGMNIRDKRALYAEVARVLRPGGFFVLQEPMAGPGLGDAGDSPVEPAFPVMWADSPDESFLLSPADAAAVLQSTGFSVCAWEDCTDEVGGSSAGGKPSSPPAAADVSIQRIVKGDAKLAEILAAGRRNKAEKRVCMVQAVLQLGQGGSAA